MELLTSSATAAVTDIFGDLVTGLMDEEAAVYGGDVAACSVWRRFVQGNSHCQHSLSKGVSSTVHVLCGMEHSFSGRCQVHALFFNDKDTV